MFKRALSIAMAFVGLTVGAGFASGQEMMQYFVSFGISGIWGVILAAVIMALSGLAVMTLGSYFQADEHTAVFDRIAHPIVSKILDWSVMVTLFATGFVMFAGAGANLQQQFDLPIWVGAILMVVLVLLTGLLDPDKVSRVIGVLTPFIIVFLLGAGIYSIVNAHASLSELEPATAQIATTLPNWAVSSLNYVGFCVMVAVSMSIVIGGTYLNPREAGIGGLIGGLIYSGLLALSTIALFYKVEDIAHEDMPMLSIVNGINPYLGLAMSLIIYAMIFNTAIGMFYALGKRITRNQPNRFYLVFVATVLVGFALSFAGFKKLVGLVYPALGYIGILLIIVLIVTYFNGRTKLHKESERRGYIRTLVRRKIHPKKKFSKKDQDRLDRAIEASNVDNLELRETVREEVVEELVSDASVDFTEEDGDALLSKDLTETVSPKVRVVDDDADARYKADVEKRKTGTHSISAAKESDR